MSTDTALALGLLVIVGRDVPDRVRTFLLTVFVDDLCAWIRMKSGATPLDADAVRSYATGRLAHYKIPRYVKVVEEFPMTVTGKIRKVQMREESARELGLG